jgi:hypothetical protein
MSTHDFRIFPALPHLGRVETVLARTVGPDPDVFVRSSVVNRLYQLRALPLSKQVSTWIGNTIDACLADNVICVECPECHLALTMDLDNAADKGHCTHCQKRGQ